MRPVVLSSAISASDKAISPTAPPSPIVVPAVDSLMVIVLPVPAVIWTALVRSFACIAMSSAVMVIPALVVAMVLLLLGPPESSNVSVFAPALTVISPSTEVTSAPVLRVMPAPVRLIVPAPVTVTSCATVIKPVDVRVIVPVPAVTTPVPDRQYVNRARFRRQKDVAVAPSVRLADILNVDVRAAISLIWMLPVRPVLVASIAVMLVSMSSALPIPVIALNVAVVPMMFAPSPVKTSVIAPVTPTVPAVTLTVLAPLNMLNTTSVPAVYAIVPAAFVLVNVPSVIVIAPVVASAVITPPALVMFACWLIALAAFRSITPAPDALMIAVFSDVSARIDRYLTRRAGYYIIHQNVARTAHRCQGNRARPAVQRRSRPPIRQSCPLPSSEGCCRCPQRSSG